MSVFLCSVLFFMNIIIWYFLYEMSEDIDELKKIITKEEGDEKDISDK